MPDKRISYLSFVIYLRFLFSSCSSFPSRLFVYSSIYCSVFYLSVFFQWKGVKTATGVARPSDYSGRCNTESDLWPFKEGFGG